MCNNIPHNRLKINDRQLIAQHIINTMVINFLNNDRSASQYHHAHDAANALIQPTKTKALEGERIPGSPRLYSHSEFRFDAGFSRTESRAD